MSHEGELEEDDFTYNGFDGAVSNEIHQLARTISRAHLPALTPTSTNSSNLTMELPLGGSINLKLTQNRQILTQSTLCGISEKLSTPNRKSTR